MEARFGGKDHQFYGFNAVGRKSMEWDLNEWRWDGDLFLASRVNCSPSDPIVLESPILAGSSNNILNHYSETSLENGKARREPEKRRRAVEDEPGFLNLKLGRQVYPVMEGDDRNWEEKSAKKTKVIEATLNRAVCQVDNCRADLRDAKDYHRRHKVCHIHSKATTALVGNAMQRFCQQCSRFHVLQEFDDGKRSCRRRLAGHNKRRRKNQADALVNGNPSNDERSSSYLLISLLRILSNMHSKSSENTKDQDLLSHLLSNLASLSGTVSEKNLSGLLQGSQNVLNGTIVGESEKVPGSVSNVGGPANPFSSVSDLNDCGNTQKASQSRGQYIRANSTELARECVSVENAQDEILQTFPSSQDEILFQPRDSVAAKVISEEASMERIKIKDFDLNNVCSDSDDYTENLDTISSPVYPRIGPDDFPLQGDSAKSSPAQTSGNSGSTYSQSVSSSSGEIQCRTDRIVFKLFGKDPNDFPLVLRTKILDWLSHSPTEIESYIRPGCVVLTIYIRMENSKWHEIIYSLGSSLHRLLNMSGDDTFWTTGWAYVRVQHRVSFIYDGQVVVDTPLALKRHQNCRISSIKPVAVPLSRRAQFVVKGVNLARPATRLLCGLEGQYLVQEACDDDGTDTLVEQDHLQCLSLSCIIPDSIGRGFIEVEDHGISNSYFPFIVAEEDVCVEVCSLECGIEAAETFDNLEGETETELVKNRALDFIHEFGWLLHRSHLRSRLGTDDPYLDLFSLSRFQWLMEFSMDRDWCAVVKRLLCVIFSGTVDVGEHTSIEFALLKMGLLHKAVRRNSAAMVKTLTTYNPDQLLGEQGSLEHLVDRGCIFKPDITGPGGLTPLHIAASIDNSDDMLDALTDDPGSVGIKAWKSAQDSTGLTPYDYACLRGYDSYVHLVQKKINKRLGSGHVVLDIPAGHLDCTGKDKVSSRHISGKLAALEVDRLNMKGRQQHCQRCTPHASFGRSNSLLAYRPATLSMVAIAAVCVCVALLLRSMPANWPKIRYGSY